VIEALKLVFKKWSAWLSAILVFDLVFPINDIKFLDWYSFEHSIIIAAGSMLIASIFVIKDLTKYPNEIEKPEKALKRLPKSFPLKVVSFKVYEWSISTRRCYRPDEEPEIEKFIDNSEISKTKCENCKSDIEWNVYLTHYSGRCVRCPKRSCDNYEKLISESEMKEVDKQIWLEFVSAVRSDFKKYWKIYCNEYNSITKGNNDDFANPVQFIWKNY